MMRADLYGDIYHKEDTYWWHVGKRLLVRSLITKYLRPLPGQIRSLDVGCGAGRVLQMLAEYGPVYGTDLSSLALRFCRQRGFNEVCQADIVAGLPFPKDSFDLITALDVIEHLEDDATGLQSLWEALKPGGLLIVSVPAYQFMFTYWDKILGHQRRYTVKTMRERLLKAGFEVERISYSNMTILAPVMAIRLVKELLLRSKKEQEGDALPAESDFIAVPKFLNRALIKVYEAENALLQRAPLPFGLAVLAAARKPVTTTQAQVSTEQQREPLTVG